MSHRPSRRLLRLLPALALVAPLPVALGAVVSPASAACQSYSSWSVSKGGHHLTAAYKGHSIYNRTQDKMTRQVSSTITKTHTDTHSWEAGGEGGFSIGVWSAKVSGKYGSAATEGVTRGTTVTDTFTIRPHYSGWEQADVWTQNYVVKLYRVAEGCPAQGATLVGKMLFHDRYYNKEAATKKGRVGW